MAQILEGGSWATMKPRVAMKTNWVTMNVGKEDVMSLASEAGEARTLALLATHRQSYSQLVF